MKSRSAARALWCCPAAGHAARAKNAWWVMSGTGRRPGTLTAEHARRISVPPEPLAPGITQSASRASVRSSVTAPVDGSMAGSVSPELASRHLPPMNSF